MYADSGPLRVLIVDDEVDFATALVERMARRGFAAVAAFSGAEAVELVERQPFDVVVLDLAMPGMDGLATLNQLRRVDPHLGVVLLTGHGSVASGIAGMQHGAADFLQKPSPIETVCAAVAAAAERALASRSDETKGGSPR